MAARYPNYIVVEGPIGVGKTTLAKQLANSLGTRLVLERAEANPFLPEFYSNPKAAALPTQLYFLCQRVQQLEALRQHDLFKPAQVADFFIQKDPIFAAATLTVNELALYQQIYQRLFTEAPVPDLVIYLQAPVEVLMQRVAKRGRTYERAISYTYLKKIAEAYIEFFYYYDSSPLFIVNTDEFDLANNTAHYQLLLKHITPLPAGRHYLNPAQL